MEAGSNRLIAAMTTMVVVGALAMIAGPPASADVGLRDGGRAATYTAGGQPAPGIAPLLAPNSEIHDTKVTTQEPSIGISRDGQMYIDATNGGKPTVVTSSDWAKSWHEVSAGHTRSLDPFLYVDPVTGRVFSVDYQAACQQVSYSDNAGKTWTTNSQAACQITDHENLFAGPAPKGGAAPGGYPDIVYMCGNGGGIGVVFFSHVAQLCAKSLDGGATFLPTQTPPYMDGSNSGVDGDAEVPGNCNADSGHGYVGPDGALYVPRGWCGQPWLAISHDEGDSWTRVQVADNGMFAGPEDAVGDNTFVFDHEAAVAADAEGNIYYSWVARDRKPYLSVSHDDGKHWTKPMDVAPPGLTQTALPALDIGGPGKVAMAFMGSTNAPKKPFPDDKDCVSGGLDCNRHEEKYKNTTWNGYIVETANATAAKPVFYGGPINAPSQPLLHGGPCGPVRCLQELDFIDVVVGPDGNPWGVFVDACLTGAVCNGQGAVVGRLVGGPSLCATDEPGMSECPAPKKHS
ncbi:MAG: hypothetical protein QOF16_1099 [Actinomycetota bacterium]|nr:hypothetical protein [Actinomycetota bacterium]